MQGTSIYMRFRGFALAVTFCGLFAVSTEFLMPVANALPPSDLKILVVDVDPDLETMTILGQDFDVIQDTTVRLGEYGALDILFENSNTLVVDLPQDIVPGNYLLEVETNGGSSGHDEFDLTIGAVGPEGPAGTQGPAGPTGPQGPEGASPWLLTNGLIHTDSDVGIGTDAVSNRLSVDGFADFSGSVGIGVSAPTTPLAIRGNGGTHAVGITQNAVGGASTMELTTTDGGGSQATRLLIRGASDEADINFYSGAQGAESLIMKIDSTTGNVGIGVNQPATRLDVDGTIHSSTGGIMFPDGTVQTTAAATGCTMHYVTTTRALNFPDGEGEYPDQFCPPYWTIEGSWHYTTGGYGLGDNIVHWNYVRQTFCSKCE